MSITYQWYSSSMSKVQMCLAHKMLPVQSEIWASPIKLLKCLLHVMRLTDSPLPQTPIPIATDLILRMNLLSLFLNELAPLCVSFCDGVAQIHNLNSDALCDNPLLSKVPAFKLGIGQNINSHALPAARNSACSVPWTSFPLAPSPLLTKSCVS